MALHLTPEDHNANPPSTWVVIKGERGWYLRQHNSTDTLEVFRTKKAAEQAKLSGWYVDLYAKEGRWFAGENVSGWKPYRARAVI